MTDTDTDLSAWERGERRRSILIGLLVGLVLIEALVIGALAFVTADLGDVLNRRSPVIARIDQSEAEDACRDMLEATFLAAVGDLIDASASPLDDPERDALALARLQITTAAITRLVEPDVDPCSIPVPPIAPVEP